MVRMMRISLHPIPAVAITALFAAGSSGGCGLVPPAYNLHVVNGTTLELAIVVAGQPIGTVAPSSTTRYAESDLPRLPWRVEARTATGRVLVSMDVASGSIVDQRALDGTGSYAAPATGIGLSCGMLEMYVGDVAPSGGGPAIGQPGDCEP
jgi:hypothetical protein